MYKEFIGEWSQDQHLKGGVERGLGRGESPNCNAFAAEASANPTSVSGAAVALQRTESTRSGTWASVKYFSG